MSHTEGVLRQGLPPLRGWGALDRREASTERVENQNDRNAYEYRRLFFCEYSDRNLADTFGDYVVWRSCSYLPLLHPSGLDVLQKLFTERNEQRVLHLAQLKSLPQKPILLISQLHWNFSQLRWKFLIGQAQTWRKTQKYLFHSYAGFPYLFHR